MDTLILRPGKITPSAMRTWKADDTIRFGPSMDELVTYEVLDLRRDPPKPAYNPKGKYGDIAGRKVHGLILMRDYARTLPDQAAIHVSLEERKGATFLRFQIQYANSSGRMGSADVSLAIRPIDG